MPSDNSDLDVDEDALCEEQFNKSIKASKKPSKRARREEEEVKPVKLVQQKPAKKAKVEEVQEVEEEGDKKDEKYSRLILFVGQIPFEATEQDLEKHFMEHGAGKVIVRLLTDKATGKSKGLAFVDFTSPQQLVCGLRVHRTRIMGRAINVERTVGGGGNNVNRKEKLVQLRDAQGTKVKKQVEALIDDCIVQSQGQLSKTDLDDLVIKSLSSLPRDAAKQVLDEVLSSDLSVAKNKKAWVLGFVKRYVSKLKGNESFLTLKEEKAGIIEKQREEAKKVAGSSRGGSRGGRGGGRGGGESRGESRGASDSRRGGGASRGGMGRGGMSRGGDRQLPAKDRFKRGMIGSS
ncbi:hypothetical protein BASA81_003866 [Batrachochytrium salamandrivorans]|nr:hypothetical protein BASA81_003866 [Batrachochytrium salamandrivorans]